MLADRPEFVVKGARNLRPGLRELENAFVRNARIRRGRVTANEGSCDVNLRASPAVSARREQ